MMKPVVEALKNTGSFGLITAARLEWVKFETGSPKALREEYEKYKDVRYTRLHLDHVPVVDEDGLRVDYMEIIERALGLGYESVMIDGSRLPLEENIRCTAEVVKAAHAADVPVEAELGAVMGHESGPPPPYDELFATGAGFTDPLEAKRFVELTGTDWLSVAIGNIHGAISASARRLDKISARLNIEHLARIRNAAEVPLVLHGGSGIHKKYVMDAVKNGIAKINVATAIRQPYEQALEHGVRAAQEAVYEAVLSVIQNDLEVEGSAVMLSPEEVR